MGAEDFNIYFKKRPSFNKFFIYRGCSLLWKGQESIFMFKFIDVERHDLIELLISFSDKTGMVWIY